MPNLDEKMSALAETVLKRPLSEEEELDIYKISDAMGMTNVQSFLYLMLVFKLHEDTMNKKFDDMAALSVKIDGTLEESIERILSDGAQKIGRDMGDYIVDGAKEVLEARDEYHQLRGQVLVVCFISIIATLAYWLGSAKVLNFGDSTGPLGILLTLQSGWIAFVCCSLYSYMWAFDHWKQVKRSSYYKGILALQGLVILALFIFMF
ncbi:hypothetical protein FACS1894204_02720 [Synergistales bacterium]|nr:hypothetical protein FACS1894204_02720 [Synergistales bacterium]